MSQEQAWLAYRRDGQHLSMDLNPQLLIRVKRQQTRALLLRDSLHIPADSTWGYVWTVEPIGARTVGHPDGQQTGFCLIDEQAVYFWNVATSDLSGGRGLDLEVFGIVQMTLPDTSEGPVPLWTFQVQGVGFVCMRPWLIRAAHPASPMVAEIFTPPELPYPRKCIVIETDEWDDKAYSKWQTSAGKAMKFLHDFRRRIDGGRPKKTQARALAEVAVAGLDYLRAHPDMTVEDLQHQHLAEARLLTTEAHGQFMTRHKLKIGDVKRAIANLQAREFS